MFRAGFFWVLDANGNYQFDGTAPGQDLAFAFGEDDVRDQGAFLERLLAPVDGFLLLDLHNLYCQMCNCDRNADELLTTYPLHRVRELHVSGGAWQAGTGTIQIRRLWSAVKRG